MNLLFFDEANVGDALSPVVYSYMLNRVGLSVGSYTRSNYTKLSCIGSIIQNYNCDFTIWGSGFIKEYKKYPIVKKYIQRFDVRSVRGPLSHETLLRLNKINKNLKVAYGDPAILMPYIYNPSKKKLKYDISFVPHYKNKSITPPLHIIKTQTLDYEHFIDEIVSSRLVISSSLHGIILSETYGIPCIWLKTALNDYKFLDYYYSTGRKNIVFAKTIEEALTIQPMNLPTNLDNLRNGLIQSFPYDLWEKE